MPDYDNTNRFVLFVNDKKGDDKRDPDRTGTLNVNGVEYFMDGWIQQGKNGPFLSGRIKPKTRSGSRPVDTNTGEIDPIPF